MRKIARAICITSAGFLSLLVLAISGVKIAAGFFSLMGFLTLFSFVLIAYSVAEF